MNILARRSFDSVRLKGITKFQKITELDKQKRERERERERPAECKVGGFRQ